MSNKGNQPLRSNFLLISGSSSSKTTFLSAHTDLSMFNVSKVSWFFSLRNLSLSKQEVEVEVDVLWALVFLTMMLRLEYDRWKRDKEEKTKKTQGQTASNTVRAKQI